MPLISWDERANILGSQAGSGLTWTLKSEKGSLKKKMTSLLEKWLIGCFEPA